MDDDAMSGREDGGSGPDVPAGNGPEEQCRELERRVERLALSRDLTREFVSTTDMRRLMGVIFERVLAALGAEAGSLWLVDWRTRESVCHQAEGPAKGKVIGLRLPVGKGVVGRVIQNNRLEVVLDTSADESFDAEVDKSSGFQTKSMICVPLVVDSHVYGAIQIINKREGFESLFTEDDVNLVEDLAASAAVSIKNARLLETESKVKEMDALLRISREIGSTLDLNQVLGVVVNMTADLVEMTGGAAALKDESGGALMLGALSGEKAIDPKDPRQQGLLELMAKVLDAGRVVYVGDAAEFKKRQGGKPSAWTDYLEAHGLAALWASPLADEEGKLGVLWFESATPDFASGGKADILSILANQTAVAVRNASLYQKVPFADTLGRVTERGQRFFAGWRKFAMAGGVLLALLLVLHFTPYFRSVSADCEVEARLGYGVFTRVAGVVASVDVKEGRIVKAGDLLATLDPAPFLLRRTQALSQLAVTERKIVEARAGNNPAEVRRLLAERSALRAEAARAAEELGQVEVRASVDGIVLSTGLGELVGAGVPQGAELMRLADPAHLTVVLQIPEENVLDVRPGQSVMGAVRSAPGERFHGRVVHVGRSYDLPPEAAEAGQAAPPGKERFIAEVRVDSSGVPLRPGMTGKARVSTPESSVVSRLFRGIGNKITFWLGP